MSLSEPMLGSKISGALENNSFAVSFMHLKLKKGCIYRWKEAKGGLEYRIVNKIMCFLDD